VEAYLQEGDSSDTWLRMNLYVSSQTHPTFSLSNLHHKLKNRNLVSWGISTDSSGTAEKNMEVFPKFLSEDHT
jgi:hypothetical protein